MGLLDNFKTYEVCNDSWMCLAEIGVACSVSACFKLKEGSKDGAAGSSDLAVSFLQVC